MKGIVLAFSSGRNNHPTPTAPGTVQCQRVASVVLYVPQHVLNAVTLLYFE